MAVRLGIALVAAVSIARTAAGDPKIPGAIVAQVPAGYAVLSHATVAAGRPIRTFTIVALGRRGEGDKRLRSAPARPLLIFEQKGVQFSLVGRNDTVVLRADEGGQCDPFLDGDATIATRGRYFTVQNGVACGQHWTDYVTFRFDEQAGGFVFDNERFESWRFNPDSGGDALVPDTPASVVRDRPHHITPFSAWRPTR